MRSSRLTHIMGCHAEGEVGDAIVSSITGRAWVTGTRQLMLDPVDSWLETKTP